MTLLVVGVSHRTAPVALLDRLALVDAAAEQLAGRAARLAARGRVAGALDLQPRRGVRRGRRSSTAPSSTSTETLAKATGVDRDELTPHLYVRYDERAVQHLFEVAAGLDSMVVGEQQILGQVRARLRSAQETATAGRSLNDLAQAALRVGKRVHADTGIDRAGISVVSVALDLAAERSPAPSSGRTRGRRRRRRDEQPRRARCSPARASARSSSPTAPSSTAQRLAEQVGGRAVRLEQLGDELAKAEILVSCTGSTGLVLTAADLAAARASDGASPPLVVVDLALPHDVDEAVAELPGVTRIDLNALADLPGRTRLGARRRARPRDRRRRGARAPRRDGRAARRADRASRCAPAPTTSSRPSSSGCGCACPTSTTHAADEVARALRRTVSTLLHTPDRAHEGARRRPRRRALRHRAAPALRPRPRGHRRDRGHRRHRPRRCSTPSRATTTCSGVRHDRRARRHPRQPARAHPVRGASPPRCRERLDGEVTLVEVTHAGRPRPAHAARRRSAASACSSRPCATPCCAATPTSRCTRSRTCPPRPPPACAVAAYPPREDARDVLVARDGGTLAHAAARRHGRHRLARVAPRSCARCAPTSTSSPCAATSTPACAR